MPTGDKQVNLFLNRLLDKTALKEQFLEFLSKKIDDGILSLTAGDSGTLDSEKIGLTSSLADTFDLDMTNARRCAVGGGQVVTLPENANRIIGEHRQVAFINTTGQVYEFGVRYASVKSGIAINARSGEPEYPSQLEEIGELGNPSAVVDDPGVKITLKIDGLTQSGVDHKNRVVRVYLTTPVSGVESIAYFDGLVKYVGGENVVEIPYSGGDGPLGQDTSVNPPMTTASEYVVHVKGASWKQGAATILGDNDYAYIGKVTGNGPAATPVGFNTDDQVAVFLLTLQKAYDGIGNGAGRTIQADDGAVRIHSVDSNDDFKSLLVLDRRNSTESTPGSIMNIISRNFAFHQANLVPVTNTEGTPDLLVESEPGTSNATAGVIDLTRTGRDMVSAGVNQECDLALLTGFASIENRLYRISAVAAAQITVRNLDGTTPTWTGSETGTVTFLRNRFSVAEGGAFNGADGIAGGLRANGRPQQDVNPLVRLFPRGSSDTVELYDRSAAPRLQGLLTRDGTAQFQTSGTPGDGRNTLLKLLRDENTDYAQFMLYCEEGDVSSIPIACLKPYNRGTDIDESMNVTLSVAGQLVTFTDGGINFLSANVKISPLMILLIYDAANEADNGLYGIGSYTGTTITASPIRGGSVSFVGGTAKARVLQPTFVVGGAAKLSSGYSLWDHSTFFTVRDVDGDFSNPIAIFGDTYTQADILDFYNSRLPSLGNPEIASRLESKQESAWNDLHLRWRHGGDSAGTPILCGHEFNLHPGGDADNFAMNIKPRPPRQLSSESLYNRAKAEFDDKGVEMRRLEQCGRIASVHNLFDDFNYEQSPGSAFWVESVLSGNVWWGQSASGAAGGIVRVQANAGIGNYARIYRAGGTYLRHPSLSPYRVLLFAGRFKPSIAAVESPNHLNQLVKCYLYFTGLYEVGVRYEASGTESQFEFYATDGVTTNTTTGKGAPGSDDDESGWFKFWIRLDLQTNQISVSWDHEATPNSNGIDAMNFPSPTNSAWRSDIDIYCEVQNINSAAAPHAGYFDYVHLMDDVIKSGGKDRNS